MSLIQEALKRQQEEDGQPSPASAPPPADATPAQAPATPAAKPPAAPPASPPPVAPPPVAPPPPPGAAAPPPPPSAPPPAPAAETADAAKPPDSPAEEDKGKKEGKPWTVLVGIILVAVLLLAGIAWGILYAYKQWAGTPPVEVVEDDPADGTEPAATVEPVEPVGDVPPDITPVTEPVEPVAGDPKPPETDPAEPIPDDTTTPDSFLPPEPEPTVAWPPLTLTGIVGKGATGSAMINGEVVGVDQRVEGARIVSIGDQGVTLEYQGKKRFLAVGASTN